MQSNSAIALRLGFTKQWRIPVSPNYYTSYNLQVKFFVKLFKDFVLSGHLIVHGVRIILYSDIIVLYLSYYVLTIFGRVIAKRRHTASVIKLYKRLYFRHGRPLHAFVYNNIPQRNSLFWKKRLGRYAFKTVKGQFLRSSLWGLEEYKKPIFDILWQKWKFYTCLKNYYYLAPIKKEKSSFPPRIRLVGKTVIKCVFPSLISVKGKDNKNCKKWYWVYLLTSKPRPLLNKKLIKLGLTPLPLDENRNSALIGGSWFKLVNSGRNTSFNRGKIIDFIEPWQYLPQFWSFSFPLQHVAPEVRQRLTSSSSVIMYKFMPIVEQKQLLIRLRGLSEVVSSHIICVQKFDINLYAIFLKIQVLMQYIFYLFSSSGGFEAGFLHSRLRFVNLKGYFERNKFRVGRERKYFYSNSKFLDKSRSSWSGVGFQFMRFKNVLEQHLLSLQGFQKKQSLLMGREARTVRATTRPVVFRNENNNVSVFSGQELNFWLEMLPVKFFDVRRSHFTLAALRHRVKSGKSGQLPDVQYKRILAYVLRRGRLNMIFNMVVYGVWQRPVTTFAQTFLFATLIGLKNFQVKKKYVKRIILLHKRCKRPRRLWIIDILNIIAFVGRFGDVTLLGWGLMHFLSNTRYHRKVFFDFINIFTVLTRKGLISPCGRRFAVLGPIGKHGRTKRFRFSTGVIQRSRFLLPVDSGVWHADTFYGTLGIRLWLLI